MGNSNSTSDDDDELDAWSKAMDPDNFKDWRERQQEMYDAMEMEKQARTLERLSREAGRERLVLLQYTSRLCDQEVDALDLISSICASSVRNNARLQIGGMISYDQATSTVVQELEGPEEAVRGLFSKIQRDPRHESILVVRESRVPLLMRKHAGFGMRIGSEAEGHEAIFPAGEGCLRVVYASRLLCSSSSVATTLIGSIVRGAASNNARMRIGGELCFDAGSGTVVQVLEGPAAAVRALYAKICGDLRHEHCTLLTVEQIGAAERRYSQWGMRQMSDDSLRAMLGEGIQRDLARLHRRWQRGVRTSKEATGVSLDVSTGQEEQTSVLVAEAGPVAVAAPKAEARANVSRRGCAGQGGDGADVIYSRNSLGGGISTQAGSIDRTHVNRETVSLRRRSDPIPNEPHLRLRPQYACYRSCSSTDPYTVPTAVGSVKFPLPFAFADCITEHWRTTCGGARGHWWCEDAMLRSIALISHSMLRRPSSFLTPATSLPIPYVGDLYAELQLRAALRQRPHLQNLVPHKPASTSAMQHRNPPSTSTMREPTNSKMCEDCIPRLRRRWCSEARSRLRKICTPPWTATSSESA